MADPSVFGEIAGYPVKRSFADRVAVQKAGLHRHRQAGISGNVNEGADAIVVSGGYREIVTTEMRSFTRDKAAGTPTRGSRWKIRRSLVETCLSTQRGTRVSGSSDPGRERRSRLLTLQRLPV